MTAFNPAFAAGAMIQVVEEYILESRFKNTHTAAFNAMRGSP
jgi:hypothetical protein